jgi:predicted ATPase
MEGYKLMKEATIKDGWRRINDLNRYPLKVETIGLTKVKGFHESFKIEFQTGLTAICGKNGVGKSTLLKLIYESLTGNITNNKVSVDSTIQIQVCMNGQQTDTANLNSSQLYYLDPSFECSKIINFITNTQNFSDFLEGIDSNDFLNKAKTLKSVSSCIGKPYKKISIYEIENALEDEYAFPFFKIELQDGSTYDSLEMGMGEHLCMFLLWYIEWIESDSILLLEELENYLAAYSQIKLLDHLAYKLSEKKIWTIITTHSEHILNKVGINNTRILYRNGLHSLSVKPENSDKYLRALGLKLNKKGVYFVEDYFAQLTFKSIANILQPEILDSREVIGLRCDSNMEKVIKHYEPSNKPFFDLMAVFDADQGDNIHKLTGRDVSAICLPSLNNLNPEEEIWKTLVDNIRVISITLSVHIDRLSESITEHTLDDHHDRYYSISSDLNVTFEQLTGAIFNQWISEDDNLLIAIKFMICLVVRNYPITTQRFVQVVSSFENEIIKQEVSTVITELEANSVAIFFDGINLNISKIS